MPAAARSSFLKSLAHVLPSVAGAARERYIEPFPEIQEMGHRHNPKKHYHARRTWFETMQSSTRSSFGVSRSRARSIFAPVAVGILLAASGLSASGCGGVSESEVHRREMVAAGRASYRAYCAGCHGPNGEGNGPATEYLTVQPSDLTAISERHGSFPVEAIHERIDGHEAQTDTTGSAMPAWGNIWRGMSSEWESAQVVQVRIDEIVAYLQTIQD
jgi:mono/diheme cytochrome c family protein